MNFRYRAVPIGLAAGVLCLAALCPPLAAQTAGSWSDPPAMPMPISDGGGIVMPTGDSLYGAPGNGSSLFFRYLIATRTWSEVAPVPRQVGLGGAMAHRPGSSLIYLLRGLNAKDFYEYDATANTWRDLRPAPIACASEKVQMTASAGRIFAILEDEFWVFTPDPAGPGTWESKAALGTATSAIAFSGIGSDVYALGEGASGLWGYSIAGDTWTGIGSLSFQSGDSTGALCARPDGKIYAISGSNNVANNVIDIFDATTGLRSGTISLNGRVARNVCIAQHPSSDVLHIGGFVPGLTMSLEEIIQGGADVWRLPLSLGRFDEALPRAPIGQPGIGPMTFASWTGAGDGEHLFLLSPSGFRRYTISTGAWEHHPSGGPSTTPGHGASIVHDGTDFYAMIGRNYSFFCRLSTQTGFWSQLEPLPVKVNKGAVLVSLSGGRFAALTAEGVSTLYFFTPPDGGHPIGQWTAGTPLPSGQVFASGSTLVSSATGDGVYVMIGGSAQFLKYTLSSGTWQSLTDLPAVCGAGASLCRMPARDIIMAFRGGGFPTLWAYDISGNSWSEAATAPGSPKLGHLLIAAGGDDLHALQGGTGLVWRWTYGVATQQPPTLISLVQRKLDGTTSIVPGGVTTEPGFTAIVTAQDPEAQPLTLELELRRTGQVFTGQLTHSSPVPSSGGSLTLAVGGLPTRTGFHWQARVVDSSGAFSTWMSFGASPDDPQEADFSTFSNSEPGVVSIGQFQYPTGQPVTSGATAFGGALDFRAGLLDPEGDRVTLEVEVIPADGMVRGTATTRSVPQASGSDASAVCRLSPGIYRWIYRVIDTYGEAGDWIEFDGPGNDFVVEKEGSRGFGSCIQSCARPAPLLPAFIAILGILALLRPRWMAAGLLLLGAACQARSDDDASILLIPPPPPLAGITINIIPASACVDVNGTFQFRAELLTIGGTPADRPVLWSSSDPAIASIDAAGVATGLAPGTTQITATVASDPAIHETVPLKVHQDAILGIDAAVGLTVYPISGGTGIPLSSTTGIGVVGVAPAGDGVYLLTSDVGVTRLWRAEPAVDQCFLIMQLPVSDLHYGLVKDRQGRLYTANVNTGSLLRYDPLSGQTTPSFATVPAWAGALTIDEADNLYLQEMMPGPGSTWVYKITPDGMVKPIANSPFANLSAGGPGGVAIKQAGGTMYIGDNVGNRVLRCRSSNDDDYLDPGEMETWISFPAGVNGLHWTGSELLVNLDQMKIVAVSGAGTARDWAAPGVGNGYTGSTLAFWRPACP